MAKPNPRRSNSHRRNTLRARVLSSEDTCWLCTLPVDVTLPPGMPDSPEIDEIIPVSLGGSPYDRDNVHLAHRLCNQRRGNRMPSKPVITTTPATSRAW